MEEIILSQMYFHDTFARTQTIFVYESVSIPYFVPLYYLPNLLPILYCLIYFRFDLLHLHNLTFYRKYLRFSVADNINKLKT